MRPSVKGQSARLDLADEWRRSATMSASLHYGQPCSQTGRAACSDPLSSDYADQQTHDSGRTCRLLVGRLQVALAAALHGVFPVAWASMNSGDRLDGRDALASWHARDGANIARFVSVNVARARQPPTTTDAPSLVPLCFPCSQQQLSLSYSSIIRRHGRGPEGRCAGPASGPARASSTHLQLQ
jgi:hypothetical protein